MIEIISETEIAVTVENESLKSRIIICGNADETFGVTFAYSSLEQPDQSSIKEEAEQDSDLFQIVTTII